MEGDYSELSNTQLRPLRTIICVKEKEEDARWKKREKSPYLTEPTRWMKFRDTLVTHSIFHFIDNHRDKKWLTNTRYKLLPLVSLTSRSFFSSHQSFCHRDNSALFRSFFLSRPPPPLPSSHPVHVMFLSRSFPRHWSSTNATLSVFARNSLAWYVTLKVLYSHYFTLHVYVFVWQGFPSGMRYTQVAHYLFLFFLFCLILFRFKLLEAVIVFQFFYFFPLLPSFLTCTFFVSIPCVHTRANSHLLRSWDISRVDREISTTRNTSANQWQSKKHITKIFFLLLFIVRSPLASKKFFTSRFFFSFFACNSTSQDASGKEQL